MTKGDTVLPHQSIYIIIGLLSLSALLLWARSKLHLNDSSEFVETDPKEALPSLVTIYLVPKQPISGRQLLDFFNEKNLQYNNQQIFYLLGDDKERFHVATLNAPGTFNLDTMRTESFNGLSFFIQPKHSSSPLLDFDELCHVLFDAKERFDAQLQSTDKREITLDALQALRKKMAY